MNRYVSSFWSQRPRLADEETGIISDTEDRDRASRRGGYYIRDAPSLHASILTSVQRLLTGAVSSLVTLHQRLREYLFVPDQHAGVHASNNSRHRFRTTSSVSFADDITPPSSPRSALSAHSEHCLIPDSGSMAQDSSAGVATIGELPVELEEVLTTLQSLRLEDGDSDDLSRDSEDSLVIDSEREARLSDTADMQQSEDGRHPLLARYYRKSGQLANLALHIQNMSVTQANKSLKRERLVDQGRRSSLTLTDAEFQQDFEARQQLEMDRYNKLDSEVLDLAVQCALQGLQIETYRDGGLRPDDTPLHPGTQDIITDAILQELTMGISTEADLLPADLKVESISQRRTADSPPPSLTAYDQAKMEAWISSSVSDGFNFYAPAAEADYVGTPYDAV